MEGMQTRLVEMLCHDCVVRILWFYGDPDPRENHIDVQLISNTRQWWMSRWRNRIRNAWAVLRNRYDWSGFQFHTPAEALGVSDVLREAIQQAWPHQS